MSQSSLPLPDDVKQVLRSYLSATSLGVAVARIVPVSNCITLLHRLVMHILGETTP
jgi:hypothetical protein